MRCMSKWDAQCLLKHTGGGNQAAAMFRSVPKHISGPLSLLSAAVQANHRAAMGLCCAFNQCRDTLLV